MVNKGIPRTVDINQDSHKSHQVDEMLQFDCVNIITGSKHHPQRHDSEGQQTHKEQNDNANKHANQLGPRVIGMNLTGVLALFPHRVAKDFVDDDSVDVYENAQRDGEERDEHENHVHLVPRVLDGRDADADHRAVHQVKLLRRVRHAQQRGGNADDEYPKSRHHYQGPGFSSPRVSFQRSTDGVVPAATDQ